MHYRCMANDCEHTFNAEPKSDKFDLLQCQYITSCETQEYISPRCLVHIDGKLYDLEKKLDKILARLEKSLARK
ncbi:hypothetical protein IXZ18_01855 [Campylobacter fetus subsp. venerealis bv. intermedius]|uniref:hypothetical protein n=1 Tax=Campylobacter fetus TaxID=196 RepID=UPI0005091D27|nr:hypothetical protein [Campylobacter fetus]AIR80918.1 hypothetical protein CFV97608_1301 [Campylobacter fetus subsp. venerealis 97/608]WKW29478.1 hypothetical protein IXZ18_01855 [Campylobacter fetus subsp. venerealis bv. intermedius]